MESFDKASIQYICACSGEVADVEMALRQLIFLAGVLLTGLSASAAAYTEIDVCNGSTIICLNDTTVQRCEETDGKFIQVGNPYVCDEGQICDKNSTDGCYTPPPFACTVTGTFPDPAVCTQFHKCTVTTSYIQHTIYLCGAGKVYSCPHKNCVSASLAAQSCSACR